MREEREKEGAVEREGVEEREGGREGGDFTCILLYKMSLY